MKDTGPITIKIVLGGHRDSMAEYLPWDLATACGINITWNCATSPG